MKYAALRAYRDPSEAATLFAQGAWRERAIQSGAFVRPLCPTCGEEMVCYRGWTDGTERVHYLYRCVPCRRQKTVHPLASAVNRLHEMEGTQLIDTDGNELDAERFKNMLGLT